MCVPPVNVWFEATPAVPLTSLPNVNPKIAVFPEPTFLLVIEPFPETVKSCTLLDS